MEADQIVLLASGTKKAEAIRDAIQGPVSKACTASALQNHPNVTFLLDAEAASLLKKKIILKIKLPYTKVSKPNAIKKPTKKAVSKPAAKK